VLLTRSPLVYPKALPLDLHVLSTPPAFVLSQDQTLQQKLALANLDTTDGTVDNAEAQTSNWHNTTSPNKKARHTVEFSKDTRTSIPRP
jgi:hypothetical protein